jgi:hypothetical protein
MVCRQGASKPVSHMSRTITMRKGSRLSLKRLANLRRLSLLRMCGCQSGPSSALPVITTFTTQLLTFSTSASSSTVLAQSGRNLISAS